MKDYFIQTNKDSNNADDVINTMENIEEKNNFVPHKNINENAINEIQGNHVLQSIDKNIIIHDQNKKQNKNGKHKKKKKIKNKKKQKKEGEKKTNVENEKENKNINVKKKKKQLKKKLLKKRLKKKRKAKQQKDFLIHEELKIGEQAEENKILENKNEIVENKKENTIDSEELVKIEENLNERIEHQNENLDERIENKNEDPIEVENKKENTNDSEEIIENEENENEKLNKRIENKENQNLDERIENKKEDPIEQKFQSVALPETEENNETNHVSIIPLQDENRNLIDQDHNTVSQLLLDENTTTIVDECKEDFEQTQKSSTISLTSSSDSLNCILDEFILTREQLKKCLDLTCGEVIENISQFLFVSILNIDACVEVWDRLLLTKFQDFAPLCCCYLLASISQFDYEQCNSQEILSQQILKNGLMLDSDSIFNLMKLYFPFKKTKRICGQFMESESHASLTTQNNSSLLNLKKQQQQQNNTKQQNNFSSHQSLFSPSSSDRSHFTRQNKEFQNRDGDIFENNLNSNSQNSLISQKQQKLNFLNQKMTHSNNSMLSKHSQTNDKFSPKLIKTKLNFSNKKKIERRELEEGEEQEFIMDIETDSGLTSPLHVNKEKEDKILTKKKSKPIEKKLRNVEEMSKFLEDCSLNLIEAFQELYNSQDAEE